MANDHLPWWENVDPNRRRSPRLSSQQTLGPYRTAIAKVSQIPPELNGYVEMLRDRYIGVLDTYEAYDLLHFGVKPPFFEDVLKEFTIGQLQEANSWSTETDLVLCSPDISFDDLVLATDSHRLLKGQEKVYIENSSDASKQKPKTWVPSIIEASVYGQPADHLFHCPSRIRIELAEKYNAEHSTLPLHRLPYMYKMMNSLRCGTLMDPGVRTFLNGEKMLNSNIPVAGLHSTIPDNSATHTVMISSRHEEDQNGLNQTHFRRLVGKDVRHFF